MTRSLVVIGHGMVGHRLAVELRARDREGRWRVTLLGEEERPAYSRVALSSYLEGRTAAELSLVDDGFLGDPLVDLRPATRVARIDRRARTVTTAAGTEIGYDALVLATGSRPFVPPVPGRELAGCFVYRTLDDLDAIRAAVRPGRTGVVVGGGLLGLEAANALRILGMRVEVVEAAAWLMPSQIDEDAGRVLAGLVEELGVRARCGAALASVDAGPRNSVRGVTLTDGARVHADLVVFSAGIRPRDDLAVPAGLRRAEGGGFLVDDRCRTGDERIWAVGECAAVQGRRYGLVAPGYRMAEAVADQLLGAEDARFPGADMSASLKLLGVEVAGFGDVHAVTDGALELRYMRPAAATYAKLVLSADARVLLGGVLAGDASAYPALHPLLGRELPASPESLLQSGGESAG